MFRRSLCAALLVTASWGTAAVAQSAPEPFRLGIMGDHGGPNVDTSGPRTVYAVQMAVDDFGGKVLGRPIEILQADFGGKTDIVAAKVRQWFDVDHVQAELDGPTSTAGITIQGLAQARDRVYLNSSASSSDFTGKLCTPTAVQWITDSYASTNAMVRALASQGLKSWYFITADQTFGLSVERDAITSLGQVGGKSLGASRNPLGTTDFASSLLQAQSANAQVVALATSGSDTDNAIIQAAEFGVTATARVAPFIYFLTNVHAVGLEKAQGTVFPETFYWDTNEETRAWSKRFAQKFAIPANRSQAAAYSATLHYLKAVAKLGNSSGAAVVAEMKKMPINDFWLKNVAIREDGRVMIDVALMQVKSPADSKYPFDYLKRLTTIPAEQAYRPLSEGGCPRVQAKSN